MLPLNVDRDPCDLARRGKLDLGLARSLVDLDRWAREEFAAAAIPAWPGLRLISGHRSARQNRDVDGAENSLHLACPSLAVDLRVGNVSALLPGEEPIWQWLGARWKITTAGRWGGDFSTHDINHFDLG